MGVEEPGHAVPRWAVSVGKDAGDLSTQVHAIRGPTSSPDPPSAKGDTPVERLDQLSLPHHNWNAPEKELR